jgi:CHAT domain-containing protein/tetratricopeptide (TPR) repeat protein
MKQQRFMWRFVVVLFVAWVGIVPSAIGQTPVAAPAGEKSDLIEAKRLNQQVLKLYQQGKYAEAVPLAQRALAIREKALSKDHPDTATSLNNLALLYKTQGRYEKAEPLYNRALVIREKVLGKDHPSTATSLNNLAELYNDQGRYEKAKPLYNRALVIWEKALGKDHPNTAISLNNLALLYNVQGRYEKAEPLYNRALAITEKVLGKDHPNTATSLNNLAGLYSSQGRYEKAEPLYNRALVVTEKALGKDHPDTANSLNNLALLYKTQGRYEKAEPLYNRALVVTEKALGKDHPDTATSLNNLALLYSSQGRYEKAEPLYNRALAIWEKALGKDHPSTSISLNNLAGLYNAQGRYEKAEPLYNRALVIREKVLGKDHPSTATSLNNLALLYSSQGRYEKAEPLYNRALVITEKALGTDHPDTANSLNNLALLYQAQGRYEVATKFLDRGLTIEEKALSRALVIGSERNKQDYINNVSTGPSFSIHLALQSNLPDAQQLALKSILLRQGRVLDSMADTIQTTRSRLQDRPDLQKTFDQWTEVTKQQSSLINSDLSQKNPAEYQAKTATLEQQQQLESQLSANSATFRQNIAPIQPEKIQTLIPQNATLVQITKYRPYNPKGNEQTKWGAPRYAAAILNSTSTPHLLDLGPATAIEKNIRTFRASLQDGSSSGNSQRNQIARTLHQQLIQPLSPYLGNTQHLLLSPDSALNLLPFEALQDQNNKYLIESYAISYLTSGRDLLRFADAPPSRQAPTVFSEINYGQSTPTAQNQSANFSPLDTAAETQQIQTLFKTTQVFRDRQATKTALQQIKAPQILHLATHGYFNPAPKSKNNKQIDNPLLRSGIILAGANQANSTVPAKEGILTGLETSALDLYGTQLVVLSACETGLGDISAGEGIYGLRRALVIAGAQSQILSLWKVENTATTALMNNFYQNLSQGQGRHAALRQAQLKLLKSANYSNPHYWAAFIPSGNWQPLPNSRGN